MASGIFDYSIEPHTVASGTEWVNDWKTSFLAFRNKIFIKYDIDNFTELNNLILLYT